MRLLACAAFLLTALPAAAERISCPLTLDEGAIKVMRPPAGWIGTSHALVRLASGGVMRGHPDGMAYLVPSKITRSKGGGSDTFVFDAGEEKWLWCGYDGSGAIQISRRLDDLATECTVHYTATKHLGLTGLYVECITPSAPTAPAR